MAGTITRFEDLDIWKLAREQCKNVEKVIQGLYLKNPRLRDQIQGSSGSVMDNIAEGFEKENRKEFINFLYHAKASCGETRSQLIRIADLGYAEQATINQLIEDAKVLSAKIKSLINYLKSCGLSGQRHVEEPKVEYLISNDSLLVDPIIIPIDLNE